MGNDHEISILDLAKLFLEETKSQSPITYLSYAEAYGYADFKDVMGRCPDVEKLTKLTDTALNGLFWKVSARSLSQKKGVSV